MEERCESVLIYVANESMDYCKLQKGHAGKHKTWAEWTDKDAERASAAWA